MLTILDHPLVKADISILRDKSTSMEFFRAAARRIGVHLANEAFKAFPLKKKEIETPLEKTTGYVLDSNVVLAPILRAGSTLINPFLELYPHSKLGYVGLRRNETTLKPEEYYYSMPTFNEITDVIILDPMIATGGSIIAAIDRIERDKPRSITVVGVISAPEGIKAVLAAKPDIRIITASLDRELNHKGYILPGLGDAGDRFCGTID